MEENTQSTSGNVPSGKPGSNFWLWVILAVIVIVVLFWFFKKPAEDKMEKTIPTPTPTPQPPADDISSLDVGDNPDVGTDDFSSTLPISQEAVNP